MPIPNRTTRNPAEFQIADIPPDASSPQVASVFGRVGAVVAQVGDYDLAQLTGALDDTQHGSRGGGALHNAAVPAGASGFMTGADKSKLDGIAPGAQVNTVTSVFGRTGAVVAAIGDYALSQISGTIDDTQHGSRAGGSLHALAVAAGAAGFMSGADKTRLDNLAVVVWQGGASMGAGDVGKFYAAQGDSAGPKIGALGPASSMTCGIAGTMKRLTFNTATGDATTQVSVYKNGLLAETKNLTGAQGSVTLATAVAINDRIALEYTGGTAPGAATFQIYAG